jgi:hypothetical protein
VLGLSLQKRPIAREESLLLAPLQETLNVGMMSHRRSLWIGIAAKMWNVPARLAGVWPAGASHLVSRRRQVAGNRL